MLTYLSGARWRVGLHAPAREAGYRGDLMTHRLLYNPHLHTAQTFLAMAESLGYSPREFPAFPLVVPPPEPVRAHFEPAAEEKESVARALESRFGGDARPLVLLNANASDLLPIRRWAPERYVELARRLLERFPEVRIAFTGGPAEQAAVDGLVRQVGSPRCASMAGRTTLRELLVLYHLAEVLVTNDSGPAHFATLTPIDAVTLFGPETPALFGARGGRTHLVWSGIACSPCVSAYNHRTTVCRNNLCMQRITVDEVFDRVARVYEARRR